jgi:hypothetical protein
MSEQIRSVSEAKAMSDDRLRHKQFETERARIALHLLTGEVSMPDTELLRDAVRVLKNYFAAD